MVSSLISCEALLGKKVIGAGGYIIGEVKGASIDTKTWQIVNLHVKLTNTAAEELGFKKRFRSSMVNMPVKMIQAVGDVVNVSPPLKEMSQSKEITEFKE
jgi:sporulation protein YlmC with PRC-barrel domain